jgi:hypothetical protein
LTGKILIIGNYYEPLHLMRGKTKVNENMELKNYQFVFNSNIFRTKYATVYGVSSYEAAKNMIIAKINEMWWCEEMKRNMLAELNDYSNSEEETEIENGTIDFPD